MLTRTLFLRHAAMVAILLAAGVSIAPAATVGPNEGMSAMFVASRAAELTASLDELNACLKSDDGPKHSGWHEILKTWIATSATDQPGKPLILEAAGDNTPGPATSLTDFAALSLSGPAPSAGAGQPSNTAALTMAPGGFGRLQVGRPTGADDWSQAGQTSMSYVRPQVNVQMALALLFPGSQNGNHFEGPGFDSRAQLSVGHRVRVDSADLGRSTESFGVHSAMPLSQDESQTALAVGMDAGILSTFLSQMGLSVQVVASQGQRSGDVIVALVGTTELPIDWAPGATPGVHPAGQGENANADSGVTFLFVSQGIDTTGVGASAPAGGGRGGGGGGERFGLIPITPLTPITPTPPVIPEPATLALLGAGLAWATARKARR
jgi:hypothetical protein